MITSDRQRKAMFAKLKTPLGNAVFDGVPVKEWNARDDGSVKVILQSMKPSHLYDGVPVKEWNARDDSCVKTVLKSMRPGNIDVEGAAAGAKKFGLPEHFTHLRFHKKK